MIKSEKKVKELSVLLAKDNVLLVSEGIGLLRNEEPFEGAIGLLASLYDKSEDIAVRKTIEDFMNDLKDQSVSKEVIAEIRKPFKPATISMLISSCWQSGLNYSMYTADLVEIFLKSDYVTAIECLTVIEESVNELSPARRSEMLRTIEAHSSHSSNEKKGLTNELVSILKHR